MKVKKLKHHSSWLHAPDECTMCPPANKIKEVLYNIKEWIEDKFIPVRVWLEYRARLKAWKPILKADRDFDSHSLYPILHLKLSRIYHDMKNGHAVHTKEEMAALRRCIKLAKTLNKDAYDQIEYRKLDKKWGKIKSKSTKVEGSEDKPGGPYYRYDMWRPKANTKAQKAQERKDTKKAWTDAEKARVADRTELFTLMTKWLPSWWD